MISPTRLTLKRPGILIPVFFLSLISTAVYCQLSFPGTGSAALGECSVCSKDYWCVTQSQAGLGKIERSSVSLFHSRPFLLKELGYSAISGQFRTGKGALGIALSTQGLTGLRQSSMWFSYGLEIHSGVSAGTGIHLWNTSITNEYIYAPGISFALGLQVRINEQCKIGMRLLHPVGWSAQPALCTEQEMTIETGVSCSFFKMAHIYAELHIKAEQGIILCNGLEWRLNSRINLRTGFLSRPYTFSWGISLKFKRCVTEFSFQYRPSSGISPLSSLTHEW
jgi:hypothetical protein